MRNRKSRGINTVETENIKIVSFGVIMNNNEVTRILEATIAEFNSKGLKFTMDDLAKRLAMSKKTLYKYFRDKESLFYAMVDYCFSAIKESEQAILEDEKLGLIEKIEAIIIVLPEKYAEIDFRRLWDLKITYPNVFKRVADRLESDWEPTLSLLESGIEQGLVRPVSLPVFKMIVEGSIEHFINGRALIDEDISYRDALQQMIEILMRGIESAERRAE